MKIKILRVPGKRGEQYYLTRAAGRDPYSVTGTAQAKHGQQK